MPTEPVRLRRTEASDVAATATRLAAGALVEGRPDLDRAVAVALDLGPRLPLPGQGDTLTLWETLAGLGAVDLTVARAVEPHADALAILAEAHRHGQVAADLWERHEQEWQRSGFWGVYAAEGAGRLTATMASDDRRQGWRLHGLKPWCSLAGLTTHALVTAWVDDIRRGLFAIALGDPGVDVAPDGQASSWVSRGLTAVTSTAISLDDVPAVAIGAPQWYLERPGFAWGGAGVAAVWYGAAVGLSRRLHAGATRREPDQLGLTHLGAVDTALAAARAVLVDAAAIADSPDCAPAEAELTAQRARQTVADACEDVLTQAGHALGPAPLTGEEEHARRVADLTVYLRQHHAERDLARQGELLLADPTGWSWW